MLSFLSTLSLRRARARRRCAGDVSLDFYPRSPCGERRQRSCPPGHCLLFLSTLSLRRATEVYSWKLHFLPISIHALLAESDRCFSLATLILADFYPRSPCGERRSAGGRPALLGRFLSTLSLRRATLDKAFAAGRSRFLSTLSLRRATPAGGLPVRPGRFLSTLSLRRATVKCHKKQFLFCS